MYDLLGTSFKARTISGVLFFIVMVGALLLSYYTFVAILIAICIGSMGEFYKIASIKKADPQKNFGIATGTLLLMATSVVAANGFNDKVGLVIFGIVFLMLFSTFIIELYREKEDPLVNISVTLTGVIYVAVPLSLLLLFATAVSPHTNPGALFGTAVYNPWIAFSYLMIVWSNDVGAYIFGSMLGKHKLFERISPNKSWEGFVGGVIVAMCVGVIAGLLIGKTQQSMLLWAGAAIIVSITGVLGDLVESMYKRAADIKDSGKLMPGHGGFLDRFDALLISAPFVFLYFLIFA